MSLRFQIVWTILVSAVFSCLRNSCLSKMPSKRWKTLCKEYLAVPGTGTKTFPTVGGSPLPEIKIWELFGVETREMY